MTYRGVNNRHMGEGMANTQRTNEMLERTIHDRSRSA